MRRAVPTGKREAECLEPLEHGEQTEPYDTDSPFRGLRELDLAPNLLPLLGDEVHEIAVQREHSHGDVFHHALRDAGLQHADQRNVGRKPRDIELIDPSSRLGKVAAISSGGIQAAR